MKPALLLELAHLFEHEAKHVADRGSVEHANHLDREAERIRKGAIKAHKSELLFEFRTRPSNQSKTG